MKMERRSMEEDEITLKDVIFKIQEYFWEVVRNWKWVVLITVPFVLFFLYQAISTPVVYNARLTFMVNEDDGGGMGGMSAILGQIGLGGGRRGKNNLDKILELARSRTIVQQVIFDSISINNKKDFLGNHIIQIYDFHEKWEEDTTGLKNFFFKSNELSTRTEKQVLKSVYSKIVGSEKVEGLSLTGYSDETGIMHFNAKTVNEELSIEICNILYKHLSEFYVTRTVEKQQQTFDVMLQKVDSVKREMASKEYQLANFLDENRGLYTAMAKRREFELQRDVSLLNEMYAITLKNFEIADFSLKNKTPFIQLIDEPMGPLPIIMASKLKNLLLGSFIGVALAFAFIILKKLYRDTVSS